MHCGVKQWYKIRMSLLLTIVDSFLIVNTMWYATKYILHLVKLHLYIYCRKAFEEHCDIQIAIDNEMKLTIYLISSFLLNLFEYIVRYVYISYLYCWDQWYRTCSTFSRLFPLNTPHYSLDFALNVYSQVPNSSVRKSSSLLSKRLLVLIPLSARIFPFVILPSFE